MNILHFDINLKQAETKLKREDQLQKNTINAERRRRI